jgi:hypothetical protein
MRTGAVNNLFFLVLIYKKITGEGLPRGFKPVETVGIPQN